MLGLLTLCRYFLALSSLPPLPPVFFESVGYAPLRASSTSVVTDLVRSELNARPHLWKRQLGSSQGTTGATAWLVAAVSGARHSILDSGVTDDSGKTTGRDCLCTHDTVGEWWPPIFFLARARREAVAGGSVF